MKLHEIIIDLSETRLKFMSSDRRCVLISKLEFFDRKLRCHFKKASKIVVEKKLETDGQPN